MAKKKVAEQKTTKSTKTTSSTKTKSNTKNSNTSKTNSQSKSGNTPTTYGPPAPTKTNNNSTVKKPGSGLPVHNSGDIKI